MTVKEFVEVLSFREKDIIELVDNETLDTLENFNSKHRILKSIYSDKNITSISFEVEKIDVITATAGRIKTDRKRFIIVVE